MRYFLITQILIFYAAIGLAQKLPKDIAKLSNTDTNKITKILEVSEFLQYENPKKSLVYAQNAFKLAKKQNYGIGTLNAKLWIAKVSINKKDAKAAQKNATEGLRTAKKLHKIYYISQFYSLLARVTYEFKPEQEEEAIEKIMEAVDICREAIDYLGILGTREAHLLKMLHLNDMNLYMNYLSLSKSNTEYWEQSIAIAKKFKIENLQMARAYNRIGSANGANYANGFIKDKQKIISYLDTSIQICDKVLKEKPDDRLALDIKANSYVELSHLYYNIPSKAELAINYAQKSLKIRLDLGYKADIANSYYNLAKAYDSNQQLDSAIFYMAKNLSLVTSLESKFIAHKNLGIFYQRNNNHKQSSIHLVEALELYNSIRITKINKVYKDAALKYEKEKKEQEVKIEKQKNKLKEVELIKQRNRNLYLVIIGFFISLFTIYLLYDNRKRQQRNKLLAAQKEELESLGDFKERMTNMIAHDLKNPLNTIIALSNRENAQKNDNGSNLLQQSGQQILRMVNNMLMFINLKKLKYN